MTTLIVTAHPDEQSVTHRAARRVRDLLDDPATVMAPLAREGFDPRFTAGDLASYRGLGAPDASVRREQDRVDAAGHLVLAFPVYWWSMPALLKGWIDRVFIAGWAFDLGDDDEIVPRLQGLTAHLLPVLGTSEASFARHGYTTAFGTQIQRGIIDFCGIRRGATAFVHDSESQDERVVRSAVDTAAETIAAAIRGGADGPR